MASAIITGSARGIGAAIALRLAQDGNLDEGSFLCGAIAGMVNEIKPCSEIIEEMISQAKALLKI